MSRQIKETEKLCSIQLCRANPKYKSLYKELLKLYEDKDEINNLIKCILRIVNKPENFNSLITSSEGDTLYLDYEEGFISMHTQKNTKTNTIEGSSIFSNKCKCSPDCKGKITYNCVIEGKTNFDGKGNSKFIIQPNTSVIIQLENCDNYLDYTIKGIYNDGMFKEDVIVKYGNGSSYYGKWKDGLPHGSGLLSLNGKSLGYDKLCRLDVEEIKIIGNFNEGMLDEAITFKLIVILDNITKKDKYNMIVYENTTLFDMTFIPDKIANITYYKSLDENPEKCYAIAKGQINKGNLTFGEIRYCNPKAMIQSYVGQFINGIPHGKGTTTFSKSHSLYSYYGKYIKGKPYFGVKKYKDGRVYTGYVNDYYNNHGEGQMDETNMKEYICDCCKLTINKDTACHKLENHLFGLKEGMWLNNKLSFEHQLTKECSKPHCNNIKKYACLNCKEYYCEECYLKHQNYTGSKKKFKYHNVMKLEEFNEEKSISIKKTSSKSLPPLPPPTKKKIPPPPTLPKTYKKSVSKSKSSLFAEIKEPETNTKVIETKSNNLGNLSDITKLEKTLSKKKKKKNNGTFVEKRIVISDKEKQDLEKGIIDEKLMNFMNDVAIEELKERGLVTKDTNKEDIKCSVTDIFNIKPVSDLDTTSLSNIKSGICIDIKTESINKEQKAELEPQSLLECEEVTTKEEEPYDSSFEDFLEEMKKHYNSDLTKKQKPIN